jgi:hypothetical protein
MFAAFPFPLHGGEIEQSTEVTKMMNTVNGNEVLNIKARGINNDARVPARVGGDCLVAHLASKTSWAWKLNATYMN